MVMSYSVSIGASVDSSAFARVSYRLAAVDDMFARDVITQLLRNVQFLHAVDASVQLFTNSDARQLQQRAWIANHFNQVNWFC